MICEPFLTNNFFIEDEFFSIDIEKSINDLCDDDLNISGEELMQFLYFIKHLKNAIKQTIPEPYLKNKRKRENDYDDDDDSNIDEKFNHIFFNIFNLIKQIAKFLPNHPKNLLFKYFDFNIEKDRSKLSKLSETSEYLFTNLYHDLEKCNNLLTDLKEEIEKEYYGPIGWLFS